MSGNKPDNINKTFFKSKNRKKKERTSNDIKPKLNNSTSASGNPICLRPKIDVVKICYPYFEAGCDVFFTKERIFCRVGVMVTEA